MNRLPVREHDHRQNRRDHERDRAGETESADADENEHAEDLLRGIGDRGERVR